MGLFQNVLSGWRKSSKRSLGLLVRVKSSPIQCFNFIIQMIHKGTTLNIPQNSLSPLTYVYMWVCQLYIIIIVLFLLNQIILITHYTNIMLLSLVTHYTLVTSHIPPLGQCSIHTGVQIFTLVLFKLHIRKWFSSFISPSNSTDETCYLKSCYPRYQRVMLSQTLTRHVILLTNETCYPRRHAIPGDFGDTLSSTCRSNGGVGQTLDNVANQLTQNRLLHSFTSFTRKLVP